MDTMKPSLNTTGVIATRVNAPVHKIDYIIRARGIRASAKAGAAHVYSDEQVELIAAELRKIAQRREEVRA